ncbi:unnamed protein product, partial [Brenthis ino]
MSIDIQLKDLAIICRGCLASSGEMKNMIQWGLVEDFCRLTNIQINRTDEISPLLCHNCEEVILKCRKFISQCRESDLFLKNVKKESTSKNTGDLSKENTVSLTFEHDNLYIDISAPNMETKIYLPCPMCCERFQKRTDLSNHLSKRHKKDVIINQRYYCYEESCIYKKGSDNNKYFSGRKYLNQHMYKVHKDKMIFCNNCNSNFSNDAEYKRHVQTCNYIYICQVCNREFKTNDRLLVHLLRKHPEIHKQYKNERAQKRKQIMSSNSKKIRVESDTDICDSPKRSFATQTLLENIKNDVTLSWQPDKFGTKKDEISTQTVFEDLLSLKTQNSEDESIFFSETMSDIQTQTIPFEFGLSRSNKETITSQTQSPDLSIKETQTCFCLSKTFKCDNFLNNFCTTSTETQTLDLRALDSDLLSFNSTETQTCFDDDMNKDL